MRKKIIRLPLSAMLLALSFFGAVLLALGLPAEAQQPAKVPRIGYLAGTGPDAQRARIAAFRQGLRVLGYVEGKNIVIEYRYAEGKLGRRPALVADLIRLKVDIILTAGPGDTRAAKETTNTIPIVMAQDPDPVGSGFVASLARSGGNITGLSSLAPELSGKRLELPPKEAGIQNSLNCLDSGSRVLPPARPE